MTPMATSKRCGSRAAAIALCLGIGVGGGLGVVPLAARADDAPPLRVCADPSNLPFSNEREEGYENRIARALADELQRPLKYTWQMQRRGFLRRTLQAGRCDVVIGTPAGLPGLLQTQPYYASSYVFVTARQTATGDGGGHPRDFDDPVLRRWRIGLQALGAEGANTPPASALARRGLAGQVVGYPMWAEESDETPIQQVVEDLASGRLDTAVLWGPIGGYLARRHADAVQVQLIDGDPQQPALAFRYEMSIGVRRDDVALRDALQAALSRRQPEIDAILDEYGVPRVSLAALSR